MTGKKDRRIWRKPLSQLKAVLGILQGSRAFGGPIQAEFGLTNRCIYRCLHCYYHSPLLERSSQRIVRKARHTRQSLPDLEFLEAMKTIEADPSRTNAFIDELISMGTHRFQFSGNGETFLHENATEFMARAKHAGCSCWALTAGPSLNREKIDALVGMGLDELRITVMAGTRELYVRTHPGSPENTFDRLRENLLFLKERKQSLRKPRPKLKLFCVVISENVEGLADFARFGESVGADEIHYRPFDDVGDPGLSRLILTEDQSTQTRRQLLEVKPYLESKGILHNIDAFLLAFHCKLDTTELYRIIPCYYPWLVVRIEPDGHLYPCCRSYLAQGNVYQQPFSEIWNAEPYLRLRQEAKTLPHRNTPVTGSSCSNCVNYMANLRVYRYLHPFQDVSALKHHVYSRIRKEQRT